MVRPQGWTIRHRPEGGPARRDGTILTWRFPRSADERLPRPRSATDGSSSDPAAASVATEVGRSGLNRVVPLMHLPEGRPSEGTGHGSDRATGGAGFGPFWHPAKRRSAFSEAGGCSRTARRSKATVRTGPDLWGAISGWRWATPQGICREAGCWQASEPLTRFISQDIVSLLRFSERA